MKNLFRLILLLVVLEVQADRNQNINKTALVEVVNRLIYEQQVLEILRIANGPADFMVEAQNNPELAQDLYELNKNCLAMCENQFLLANFCTKWGINVY